MPNVRLSVILQTCYIHTVGDHSRTSVSYSNVLHTVHSFYRIIKFYIHCSESDYVVKTKVTQFISRDEAICFRLETSVLIYCLLQF